jgi:glutaredoxin 2
MEWNFGVMEVIFLVSCIIIFIQNRMKKSETEIDRILREAEQVKHTHAEVIYIRSEIHDDEIYIWDVADNTFLSQGKTFEDAMKKFMKNNPNKKLQIKVTE